MSPERLVAVVSGKGGVGKTNLAANLAVAAARLGARVLLVDGDLGLANVDVLLGLVPRATVADVLEGRCALGEVLLEGPRGVHVLPAASGRVELAALPADRLAEVVELVRAASAGYDLMLLDAATGVGPAAIGLAGACGRALLVTTPEPTSLADAYATLKLLRRHAPATLPEVLVNGVGREGEAVETHRRLERLARRFLGLELRYRGWLPRDPRLAAAVARQQPVVELYPGSPSARRLVALSQGLLADARLAPGCEPHVAPPAP